LFVGEVVLNEVVPLPNRDWDYSGSTDWTDQWIELHGPYISNLEGLQLHFVSAGTYLSLSGAVLYNYLVIFPGMYDESNHMFESDTVELLSNGEVIDTVTWTLANAYPGESYRRTGQGTWYWGVNPSIGRANP
jgi:hypothetical protein